jgi:hypothetical protein
LREVFAADGTRPTVDLGEPKNVVTGRKGDQVAVIIRFGMARDRALLAEAAAVDKVIDPFSDGELSAFVLRRDSLCATEFFGKRATRLNSIDFVFPTHV